MIVEHVVHEANLAWAVAEAAKPYLNAVERNAVFVAIGAGETFAAIRGLLRSVEIKRIPLGLDLLQQCRMWLRGYGGHDDERHLRRLIEEPLIYIRDRGSRDHAGHPCTDHAKTAQLAALLRSRDTQQTRRSPRCGSITGGSPIARIVAMKTENLTD
jgi:hypothetical protein